MREARILAIGDNVVDKYISRGTMYPGGQCVNTCVYATQNGAHAAYLGKFGDDFVADYNCKILARLGIDNSHSRHFHGANGAARVTLIDGDRVFLGSNRGGVAKEHPFSFTQEDLDYIRTFDLIYTNGNSYIDEDIPWLAASGVPIAYDFSDEWQDETLAHIAPYLQIALVSCSHLDSLHREEIMTRIAGYGVKLVIGTMGKEGSCALYQGEFLYASACKAEKVIDTMGAGDSYFATLITSLLQDDAPLFPDTMAEIHPRLANAMGKAARFAAQVCGTEGAFGYGTPIVD